MSQYNLIVCGGRDFSDYQLLSNTIFDVVENQLTGEDLQVSIVSGMARGADALAVQFCKEHNAELVAMPADWDKHGKSAGYIRNTEMIDISQGVIAFWDGKSKGTKHTIDSAGTRGLDVFVINY